jgi:F-type H+-transporting ATPase subunit a
MKPALAALIALLAFAPPALEAQESHAAPPGAANLDSAVSAAASRESRGVPAEALAHGGAAAQHGGEGGDEADIITPHITDSHHLEIPTFRPPFVKEVELPRWAPIHVGGVEVDLSPTKHVVMLLLAATLCTVVLVGAAAAHRRSSHASGSPRGFAAGIEAMVLYLRDEVALKNIHGPGAERYVPFILTLFFFILFANLLGLIPYGSTATGNISVTATLAIITFIVVEVAGMRAQGVGYLNTIFYWNKEMPLYMRIPLFLILSPVELLGKFTKPFALAIRLFANMTAGHIVVLAFIGLIFFFGNLAAGAPFLMAVAIMLLELFVAFLQAFIFSLLASVFIGQLREAQH